MNAPIRILAGACALVLTALTASAQVFVGSDNFNDNSLSVQIINNVNGGLPQVAGRYRVQTDNANGTGNQWAETNQRLEYTTTNTSAFNRGFLAWASPTVSSNATGSTGLSAQPYTSNWTSSLTVTNTITSFSPGGFSSAGFEIYTTNSTNSGSNGYYGLNINNNQSGQFIDFEWGRWNQSLNSGNGDFDRTQLLIATDDITDVILRMSFDASTKVLTADFSKDGGTTFLTGTSFDLDGAQVGSDPVPYNNGFGLEFYASASAGVAINSGDITFDNFSVSAIPEPSTYAAFAGVGALGLAFWQRRRRAAA